MASGSAAPSTREDEYDPRFRQLLDGGADANAKWAQFEALEGPHLRRMGIPWVVGRLRIRQDQARAKDFDESTIAGADVRTAIRSLSNMDISAMLDPDLLWTRYGSLTSETPLVLAAGDISSTLESPTRRRGTPSPTGPDPDADADADADAHASSGLPRAPFLPATPTTDRPPRRVGDILRSPVNFATPRPSRVATPSSKRPLTSTTGSVAIPSPTALATGIGDDDIPAINDNVTAVRGYLADEEMAARGSEAWRHVIVTSKFEDADANVTIAKDGNAHAIVDILPGAELRLGGVELLHDQGEEEDRSNPLVYHQASGYIFGVRRYEPGDIVAKRDTPANVGIWFNSTYEQGLAVPEDERVKPPELKFLETSNVSATEEGDLRADKTIFAGEPFWMMNILRYATGVGVGDMILGMNGGIPSAKRAYRPGDLIARLSSPAWQIILEESKDERHLEPRNLIVQKNGDVRAANGISKGGYLLVTKETLGLFTAGLGVGKLDGNALLDPKHPEVPFVRWDVENDATFATVPQKKWDLIAKEGSAAEVLLSSKGAASGNVVRATPLRDLIANAPIAFDAPIAFAGDMHRLTVHTPLEIGSDGLPHPKNPMESGQSLVEVTPSATSATQRKMDKAHRLETLVYLAGGSSTEPNGTCAWVWGEEDSRWTPTSAKALGPTDVVVCPTPPAMALLR